MNLKLGPEDAIQYGYFQMIRSLGKRHPKLNWVFSIPNGSKKTKAVAQLFQMTGLTKGVWDVFIPFPVMGVPGYWIEFKQPGEYLSIDQKRFRDEVIIPGGFKHDVFRDWGVAVIATFDYLCIVDETITSQIWLPAKR